MDFSLSFFFFFFFFGARRRDNPLWLAADRIAKADADTRSDIGGAVGNEEGYTVRLATRIQDRLDGFEAGGVRWHVFTYTPNKAQEAEHGGDMVVAINLSDGKETRSKFILVQAKVNKGRKGRLVVDDKDRLLRQCHDMLDRTDAAFVATYSASETRIAYAADVLLESATKFAGLSTRGIRQFFFDVFRCKDGDRTYIARTSEELRALARHFGVRSAVGINGSHDRLLGQGEVG